MIKAVIDTNVLYSGLLWKGPPYEVLQAWRGGAFRWVVTPEIMQEYRKVLDRLAREYPEIRVDPLLEIILMNCELVTAKPLRNVCRDRDDEKFIAAALAGGAGYAVSGDKDLLDIESYRAVHILKAAEFLRIL